MTASKDCSGMVLNQLVSSQAMPDVKLCNETVLLLPLLNDGSGQCGEGQSTNQVLLVMACDDVCA